MLTGSKLALISAAFLVASTCYLNHDLKSSGALLIENGVLLLLKLVVPKYESFAILRD